MERRKTHIAPGKYLWLDHYFDLPLWSRAALLGVLAIIILLSMDESVHLFGYPWFFERVFEDGTEGFAVAGVVFWLSRVGEQRVDRRMREIGFLNHSIRNAMQTIEFATTGIPDPRERVAVVHSSVRRVVETLSKVTRESDDLGPDSNAQYAS